MEDRVLIEVYLPIQQLSIDVYLPAKATLERCCMALQGYLQERYPSSMHRSMLLYDAQHDKLLDPALLVEDSGLQRGSRLIGM